MDPIAERLDRQLVLYGPHVKQQVRDALERLGIEAEAAAWLDFGADRDTLWIAADAALVRLSFPAPPDRETSRLEPEVIEEFRARLQETFGETLPAETALQLEDMRARAMAAPTGLGLEDAWVRVDTTPWVVVRDPELSLHVSIGEVASFSIEHPRRSLVTITNPDRIRELTRFAMEASRRARGR